MTHSMIGATVKMTDRLYDRSYSKNNALYDRSYSKNDALYDRSYSVSYTAAFVFTLAVFTACVALRIDSSPPHTRSYSTLPIIVRRDYYSS